LKEVKPISLKVVRGFLLYLVIAAISLVVIFPFYWMIITSIQIPEDIYTFPPRFFPNFVGLRNYVRIFFERPLALWLGNTVFVGGVTALLSVGLAIWTSYSLCAFKYRGKSVVSYLLLATQMLPGILIVVPIYMFFSCVGLTDNLVGLIVAYLSFLVPTCVWLMRGFIDSVPRELEEAAMTDGCGRIGAFLRITLPLLLPGIAATLTFAFLIVWDEYLFVRVLIRSESNFIISRGLSSYIGQYVTPWDSIMSAATVATLPAVILFGFFQRYLIQGLTGGAVKG